MPIDTMTRLSITLPSNVHQAAKLQAVQTDRSLTELLATIIDSTLCRRALPKSLATVRPGGNHACRPSVCLREVTMRRLEARSRATGNSIPALAARYVYDYFTLVS